MRLQKKPDFCRRIYSKWRVTSLSNRTNKLYALTNMGLVLKLLIGKERLF